ncbi:MAG: WD40/YVTN/BNR-like repeat-containing protein [Candidatus Promineifilaceae bacterium]
MSGLSAPADESSAGDPVALAYNPADGALFKARTGGLFRWRKGGGWESIALPRATSLSGVVINPEQPQTIYVSGLGLGVSRSDDGGASWRAANSGLPDPNVTALAIHSFRRETVFAWLEGLGTYRTEDGGENWNRVPDQGPPDQDVRGLVHSSLPGSMNTGWLYASTPTGAYLSMDCF